MRNSPPAAGPQNGHLTFRRGVIPRRFFCSNRTKNLLIPVIRIRRRCLSRYHFFFHVLRRTCLCGYCSVHHMLSACVSDRKYPFRCNRRNLSQSNRGSKCIDMPVNAADFRVGALLRSHIQPVFIQSLSAALLCAAGIFSVKLPQVYSLHQCF